MGAWGGHPTYGGGKGGVRAPNGASMVAHMVRHPPAREGRCGAGWKKRAGFRPPYPTHPTTGRYGGDNKVTATGSTRHR